MLGEELSVTTGLPYGTLPSPPPRLGYTFVDWYLHPQGLGAAIDEDTMVVQETDHTLYAFWDADIHTPYSVEHFRQDDTGYVLVETENLTGTTDTVANASAKSYAGYSLNPAYEDFQDSGTINGEGNLVLRLFYAKNVSVTFECNGGSSITTLHDLPYGSTIEEPLAPTFDTFTFGGWFSDASFSQVWTFSTSTVETDITLYAKWNRQVGSIGPAGGLIFYDDEADGTDDITGFRYLEAAPVDTEQTVIFGYYRTSVNAFSSRVSTFETIGKGQFNTQNLTYFMANAAYEHDSDTATTTDDTTTNEYAAQSCSALSITKDSETYDDWFLPSKEELALLYQNLKRATPSLGGFSDSMYWSSSEGSSAATEAWSQHFGNGTVSSLGRSLILRIRAIRAF